MKLLQNKQRKGPKAMIKMVKGWLNAEELTKEAEQTGSQGVSEAGVDNSTGSHCSPADLGVRIGS